MKCLIIFMRLACERRRASEIGIADSCNDLGAMAWAMAPELVRWHCPVQGMLLLWVIPSSFLMLLQMI